MAKTNTQRFPILNNAPIVEAILDIQVQLPSKINLNDIKKMENQIEKDFPELRKRYKLSGKLEFDSKQKHTTQTKEPEVVGFIFLNQNNNKIIQTRLDGFTFSLKEPYESWESLKADAAKYWNEYKEVAQPISIKRIGLRYINKIPLKTPFEPGNYFKTIPRLASDLEYNIFNLFSQLSIYNDKISSKGVITELVEKSNEKLVKFVLDIDVFKEKEIDLGNLTIWKDFEDLRSFKNEIFFKSITEKTLSIIK